MKGAHFFSDRNIRIVIGFVVVAIIMFSWAFVDGLAKAQKAIEDDRARDIQTQKLIKDSNKATIIVISNETVQSVLPKIIEDTTSNQSGRISGLLDGPVVVNITD